MERPPFPLTLDDRLAELFQARRCLLQVLSTADPCALEPGRWSAAEIVYHLHLAENSIVRLLKKRLASGNRHDPASEDRLREEWERIRSLVAERTNKARAPEFATPQHAPALAEAMHRLEESRQALLEVLGARTYNDLLSISMPHAFQAIGLLTGAGWLSLIAAHEERHSKQLRELAVKTPAP